MSLAECVAALLLLGVGALGGLRLVTLSVCTGDALQRSAAVHTLLAGRLEERLALPFDDPALDPGETTEELTLDGRHWRLHALVTSETDHRKLVTLWLTPADGGPGPRLCAWVVR